jgi:hypothetical protein
VQKDPTADLQNKKVAYHMIKKKQNPNYGKILINTLEISVIQIQTNL